MDRQWSTHEVPVESAGQIVGKIAHGLQDQLDHAVARGRTVKEFPQIAANAEIAIAESL